MKKLVFSLITSLLVLVTLQAQDAKSLMRDADRSFRRYQLDQTNNKQDFREAVASIDKALDTEEGQAMVDAWLSKGEIYNEIATQIVTIQQLGMGDPAELPDVANPALESYDAYTKALERADKRSDSRKALEGIYGVQQNLTNMGIFKYEAAEYNAAFLNFKSAIDAHNILKENGEDSRFEEESDLNEQYYIAGLAALNANMTNQAKPYFQALYEKDFDRPAIYEAMYKINADQDREAAYEYLATGREKYPDDVSLLFAEINHYLQIGELDVLITRLEDAIEREPDNVSLYTTTGSVYDQLYQKSLADGDTTQADKYFASAEKYYEDALKKNPESFDAIYSLGTLYYNKAAGMTQRLQEYADDYSQEGIKKYEALRDEIFAEFDKALPYFKQAEQLDPNDINTLIALKEIYARKDDLELSNAFKDRLERVQAGETFDSSYFNR